MEPLEFSQQYPNRAELFASEVESGYGGFSTTTELDDGFSFVEEYYNDDEEDDDDDDHDDFDDDLDRFFEDEFEEYDPYEDVREPSSVQQYRDFIAQGDIMATTSTTTTMRYSGAYSNPRTATPEAAMPRVGQIDIPEIAYDQYDLPIDNLRNEHCYINDDFNVLYWFLRNLGELNSLALNYDRDGLTLDDLERDLAQYDLILTQHQEEFSRINIRQIKDRMRTLTPRLFAWSSSEFIRILAFNIHKKYYTTIRDDLSTGANVKVVFLGEFIKMILDKVHNENLDLMNRQPDASKTLYDRLVTQMRNGNLTVSDTSVHSSEYYKTFWQPTLMLDNMSIANPFREIGEILNRSLSWSNTREGSDFWGTMNNRTIEAIRDISQYMPNVDLFAHMKKCYPGQIRVNTETRIDYIEPNPLANSNLLEAIV